jgi:hypothetical protein
MSETTFTVTEEHIRILKHAHVRWDPCEYGAPAIDPKRPYGNSSVEEDIIEILGWDSGECCPHCGEHILDIPEDLLERAYDIHHETETVLQIFLSTGEMKAGCYRKVNYKQWQLVF